jgi:hypothetical protein
MIEEWCTLFDMQNIIPFLKSKHIKLINDIGTFSKEILE